MRLEIGPVANDRRDDWWAIQEEVFAFEFKEGEKELFTAVQDWDRVFGAYDGEKMVGSAASLTFSMTVPGGASVPTAGLTAVAVLPTHRRSGALTSMIRATFADARDRGEPLAALLASETPIYGRFGYGVATHSADLVIDHDHAALKAGPHLTGRVRFMDVEEAKEIVPDLHRASTAGLGIPGSIERTDPMWVLYFHDPEHWRDGATKRKWAVYENAGGQARGYVRYRVKEKWENALPQYTLLVIGLHAMDAEAYAALYSFCFSIDLVSQIKVYSRSVGEPIHELLADPRRVKRSVHDGLWVRLVDVPAALTARRYRVPGSLVIEVQDDFCPWNEGRFLLEAGPDGAECTPSDADPDLRIGASDLASAYLGDERFGAQAWTGRVDGSPEAIERAALMFSWGREPWNTVDF